ncbi:MAG: TIGR01212 family radical SAM protein [Deltaproteobacteria bacterium]|nr:TIGR01212 family radical SAM protein [Deltaproteobacteria bacterium]
MFSFNKNDLAPFLYNEYSRYLKNLFGCRVQKITLDAGLTCPNRDGTKGQGGCIYCDTRGAGSGAARRFPPDIREQIRQGKEFLGPRYGARKFIAYFQSFSNTYAPLPILEGLYREALEDGDVVGLAVGTRPDCLSPEILDLLGSFGRSHLVWVEFGLQSFHPETLLRINRGHTVEDFITAVAESRRRGLNICAHVILGLPGEGLPEILETARRLSDLDIQGLKLHSLFINRGTPLETWYREGRYQPLTREQYVDWVCRFIELVPGHWIMQRLTGDPQPVELVAPAWALEKRKTLALINETLKKSGGFQGSRYGASGEG